MLLGYATVLMATVSLILRASVWLFGPPALQPAARLDTVAGTKPPETRDDVHDV